MIKKIIFNRSYFTVFLSIFLVEIIIATYFHSGFIRNTFGDYLVVILMYCFIKSFYTIKSKSCMLIVLCIAYLIEFLQATNILSILNLSENTFAKLILGTSFSFIDLLAYTLGILTILLIDSFTNPS